MARYDLALYVRSFKGAASRFAASGSDWETGFASIFEAVSWSAAIRDHLITQPSSGDPSVADQCPQLEAMYAGNVRVRVVARRERTARAHRGRTAARFPARAAS